VQLSDSSHVSVQASHRRRSALSPQPVRTSGIPAICDGAQFVTEQVAIPVQRHGGRGVVPGKTRRTTVPAELAARPGDLLERDFTAPAPNRRWVALPVAGHGPVVDLGRPLADRDLGVTWPVARWRARERGTRSARSVRRQATSSRCSAPRLWT
jgi:hypothetical protein